MTFERLLQSTGRTFYSMITQGTGAIVNMINCISHDGTDRHHNNRRHSHCINSSDHCLIRAESQKGKALRLAIGYAVSIMLIGTILFQIFPTQLLGLFNASADMVSIGVVALSYKSPFLL